MSVHLRTKVAHLGGAYGQVQPHGAKEWGSVCGAAWRRRRARRRRKRTVAEAGRMLCCVSGRGYPSTCTCGAQRQAWCRQRGAGSVVQVGGSGARQPGPGSLTDLWVFSGGFRGSGNECPGNLVALGSPALGTCNARRCRLLACNRLSSRVPEKCLLSACAADFSIGLSLRMARRVPRHATRAHDHATLAHMVMQPLPMVMQP